MRQATSPPNFTQQGKSIYWTTNYLENGIKCNLTFTNNHCCIDSQFKLWFVHSTIISIESIGDIQQNIYIAENIGLLSCPFHDLLFDLGHKGSAAQVKGRTSFNGSQVVGIKTTTAHSPYCMKLLTEKNWYPYISNEVIKSPCFHFSLTECLLKSLGQSVGVHTYVWIQNRTVNSMMCVLTEVLT